MLLNEFSFQLIIGVKSCIKVTWFVILLTYWSAVAQWGKEVVLQPQGRRFHPRSPH